MAEVTVSAQDEGGSGVGRIEWIVNATGASGVYEGPLVLPALGEIHVRAYDNAGNFQGQYSVGVLDDHPSQRELVSELRPPHVNASAYLGYAGDVDWWGFELAGGRVQFQLIGLEADYDLALFDADGKLLASSTNRGTRAEKIEVSGATGRIYLRVTGYENAWSAEQPYTLNVTPRG
jgi:hypothetical protein